VSAGTSTVTQDSVPSPVLLHVTFIVDPSPRFVASVGSIDFRISFSTIAGVNVDPEPVSVAAADVVAAGVVSEDDEPPHPVTATRAQSNAAAATRRVTNWLTAAHPSRRAGMLQPRGGLSSPERHRTASWIRDWCIPDIAAV